MLPQEPGLSTSGCLFRKENCRECLSWVCSCTTYYTVVSGDSCTSIESSAHIAIADFLRWNPEVTINCDIDLAEAYCTAGPSPCKTVYTVASGDFCFAIASNAGITVAQLMALNPFIDSNCDLQVGWNLCVTGAS
ncbi:hypothetical protein BDZ97DRAFT_1256265 [Flammula alnicola]|nr:hypothetical protein BDZ97DRAFT_1256265 [Flammula alnicola]